jgi:hypothetical protein
MEAQTTLTNDQIFLNALDTFDRDSRIAVAAHAMLCRDGKQHEDIFVENISIHGIRATCRRPPSVGEAVQIELTGAGTLEGVVRWKNQYDFEVYIFESIALNLFLNPQEY